MAILKKDRIYELLRQRILDGEYAPETRLPRELDFARQEGVAFQTMRSALGRLELDGLIARIPGKGTFVKAAAQTPATANIAVIIPEYHDNPRSLSLFSRHLVGGCLETAYIHGMGIELFAPQIHIDELKNMFNAKRIRGIVWDRPVNADYSRIGELRDYGIPMVAINRKLPSVPSVFCDYSASLHKVLHFFNNIGHRHVALIDHYPQFEIFTARQNYFRDMLAYSGVDSPGEYIITPHYIQGWHDLGQMLRKFRLGSNPGTLPLDAIICNSFCIHLLHKYLEYEHIQIPRDLSLVLWGENDDYNASGSHPYAILTEPRKETGMTAVEMIVSLANGLLDHNESKLIEGELLVRRGCAGAQRNNTQLTPQMA